MQRPVMNPNLFHETEAATPSRRRKLSHWAWLVIYRPLRSFVRLMMYDPFHHIVGFRVEDGTPTSRFMRGLMYRLAFVPVMIALTCCAIVWVATHPRSVTSQSDPAWSGVYYEAVSFASADSTSLEAWLVPVLEARDVLAEKEKVLKKKHPAIVLIHDIGQRREQMLPLIKPLHDAGYVVMALNLRGGGDGAARGETFGLNEANDVRAAVENLRRRPFVDPHRIVLVGCGTGATAAMLVAAGDSSIAAVVAERPVKDSRELLQSLVMPQSPVLKWLAPLCKWTFEISYGVDVEDVELHNFRKLFDSRPVLLVDASGSHTYPTDPVMVEQVADFLKASVPPVDALADAK